MRAERGSEVSVNIYEYNGVRPEVHNVLLTHTNVFHASFFCFMDGDEEIEIDARTSDAIAIAIRMGCPIFTYNDILQEAGIILTDDLPKYKDEDTKELEESKDLLSTLSLGELKKQMKEAINDENYERASELRDEINKRKEK